MELAARGSGNQTNTHTRILPSALFSGGKDRRGISSCVYKPRSNTFTCVKEACLACWIVWCSKN